MLSSGWLGISKFLLRIRFCELQPLAYRFLWSLNVPRTVMHVDLTSSVLAQYNDTIALVQQSSPGNMPKLLMALLVEILNDFFYFKVSKLLSSLSLAVSIVGRPIFYCLWLVAREYITSLRRMTQTTVLLHCNQSRRSYNGKCPSTESWQRFWKKFRKHSSRWRDFNSNFVDVRVILPSC